uniref:Uncharacterized protein n=1 Tax=Solanum lycopersicum TaxID=4081 RepID=A0A3Q7GR75_SOLLC
RSTSLAKENRSIRSINPHFLYLEWCKFADKVASPLMMAILKLAWEIIPVSTPFNPSSPPIYIFFISLYWDFF